MEGFVEIFLIAIIILLVFIYFEGKSNEVTYVKAEDKNSYLVRNLPDKKKAANLIARTRQRLLTLTKHLQEKKEQNARITRFVQNFHPEPKTFSESTPDSKYTSYSVNKGEKVVFCLRSRNSEEKLVDDNLLMFVALHEMAHIMTKSIGHTDEFWENFRYLLRQAIEIDLYQPHDFRNNPVEYCGTQITDSPL